MTVRVVVSDSFNRANSASSMGSTDSAYGGTSTAWIPLGGSTWGVLGTQAYNPAGNSQAITVVETGHADCTIECLLAGVGNTGLCWRVSDNNNNYVFTAVGAGTVYKRVAGSYTSLGNFVGGAPVAGDVIKIVVSGNTHTIYRNGVQAIQFTDAFNATATRHGLRSDTDASSRFDDFKVSVPSTQPTTVPPGAINCCTDCTGELVIEGEDGDVSMHSAQWCLTDLSSLWEEPNLRGANVVIPGIAGRHANPRRIDETDYALPFLVSGTLDLTGVLAADENQQLFDTLAFLRAQILDPPAPPTATRASTLYSPDGGTALTADIQIMPLVQRYRRSGIWVGTFHLVIPAGAFA